MGASISWPDGTILGTDLDDYLYGTDEGNLMIGFKGNDHIRGNGGGDGLYGYEGNDLLEGGAGSDRIEGGLGNDTASYFNTFHGVIANLEFGTAKTLGAGPVYEDFLVSIENLEGSFYDDHIQGNELHNRLDGVAGNDVLMGWGGDDFLTGGFGVDFVIGGDGTDTVSGGFDNDTLQGNEGFDAVDYSYSYQGMFISLASGEAHALTTISGNFNHTYQATQGTFATLTLSTTPTFYVDTGSSYVDTDSLSGFEKVIGTHFNDVIEGDQNGNVLMGGGGNDKLTGFGGNDTMNGGEGDDFLDGGAGADGFYGGAGIDMVSYRASGNVVGIDLSTGYGKFGDALWDRYFGIENLTGTTHAAGDMLTGNAKANQIEGLGGSDVINGGRGADVLVGGMGRDGLTGGLGTDRFDFNSIAESVRGANRDTIQDFSRYWSDKIDLSTIDANTGAAGNQAFVFIGAQTFAQYHATHPAVFGMVRFAGGIVQANVNASLAADFEIGVPGMTSLAAGDFIL